MAHDLRQWPGNVYPEETDEFPDARADIDVALLRLRQQGPMPEGYEWKNLGRKSMEGLWQLNLKIAESGRQVRLLYAPYGRAIVLFHIHKKSSPQEQKRAYTKAKARKRKAENIMKQARNGHVGLPTIN